MATIVTRAGKGSPLSITEHDANLTNLNDAVVALGADGQDARITVNENDIDTLQTDVTAAESDIDDLEVTDALNNTHRGTVTGNPHAVTQSNVGLSGVSNDAQLKRAAGDITSFTEKESPVEADVVLIEDSADSNAKKSVQLGKLVALSPAGIMDNFLINGDFDIWQRGSSFLTLASWDYGPDRWSYYKNGTMVHRIDSSTNVPTLSESNNQSKYSMLVDVTTVDAVIDAGNYCNVSYALEGWDFANLIGKTVTFSFWVMSSVTGIYCVSFQNGDGDRSYVSEYTINTQDTWEKKSVTLTLDSTGTWDITNGVGLYLNLALAVGSTFQTTADTWVAGGYLGTSNQVNACDNASNNFRVSQVKLEIGSTATSFVGRLFAEELALCQRYFEKSYNLEIAPGTASTIGLAMGWDMGSSRCDIQGGTFVTPKRGTPTITVYDAAGNSGQIADYNNVSNTYSVSSISGGNLRIMGQYLNLGSAPGSVKMRWHWTAAAEL